MRMESLFPRRWPENTQPAAPLIRHAEDIFYNFFKKNAEPVENNVEFLQ